jgi:CRISPR-associated protein Csd1
MILQSLNELYTRLAEDPSYEIAPPGFSPQKISFRIVIKPDGTLFSIEDARVKNARGKLEPARMEAPLHEKRTSGIKAQFLCDKQEYLLGRQIEGKRDGGGAECFTEFKNTHLSYEKSIDSSSYSVLCRFLENWTPAESTKHVILDQIGTNFGVFQILGTRGYLHDDPKIKAWWLKHQLNADFAGAEEQCLVTGEVARICRIHPDIKGFKSSVALVGIQENTSYESYGRSKAENCPISEEVAFRYATALNALLDGPQKLKHRIKIAGTTAVFWTEKPTIVEDYLAELFSGGSMVADELQDVTKRLQIQRLLESVRTGKKFQEFGEPETPFYILGLEQPNPGRFSIRFFHRSTVADLLARLHDYQKNFEMVRQYTEQNGSLKPDPEFPSIMDILRQTPPPKGKWPDDDKIPPLLSGALTRAIVEGTPYPEGLFSAIIRRIQADRTINYLRAATIKAVLVRNHHQTIPTMLDTENTDPAYLLGRLFSTLEKSQEDALGNVNAGIRDRFYSAASSTPASVFPRLLRTYQHWLSKLNGGAKVNRERLVQEIMSSIGSSGFPNQFPLKKQGVFAIGYYHQRKDFFTKKETSPSTGTESATV